MRCRHTLDNGIRCERRRDPNNQYCWQHRMLYEVAPEPTGIVAPVTPEFILKVIQNVDLPVSYRRQFAVEFCEAFHEANPTFDTGQFMAMVGMTIGAKK